MSGVGDFLNDLDPFSSAFLVWTITGAVAAIISGLIPGPEGSVLHLGLGALVVWIIVPGLFFGGVAWAVETLSLWRRSLTRRLIHK